MKEIPSCTHVVSTWNINFGWVAIKAADPEQKRIFLDIAVNVAKDRLPQRAARSTALNRTVLPW